MDYKSTIIENAWWDVAIDYGLLHVQLATPIVVLITIGVVMFALNQLLFKPVLKTLDRRENIINSNHSAATEMRNEVQQLSLQYEKKLSAARQEVQDTFQSLRLEAQTERETTLSSIRKKVEVELEQKRSELEQNLSQVQEELKKASAQFADVTVTKLLS